MMIVMLIRPISEAIAVLCTSWRRRRPRRRVDRERSRQRGALRPNKPASEACRHGRDELLFPKGGSRPLLCSSEGSGLCAAMRVASA